MTVSDPLLKELKGLIIALRSSNEKVTDTNRLLQPLCFNLERTFAKGLKAGTWFGKTEFWKWISKLGHTFKEARISPCLSMAIAYVKKCKKTKTDIGRGRLFIRVALVEKVLHLFIKMLLEDRLLAVAYYTETGSILGNEILKEILLSLLLELKEVDFKLLIKNCSCLDIAWEIPTFKQYELVPCTDLGLDIRLVKGYPLVIQVDEKCVPAEDGKVEVGDVLDEMCGECLRGVGKSGVYHIFNQYEGQPILLSVIKRQNKNGDTYQPIQKLLQRLNQGDVSPSRVTSSSGNSQCTDFEQKPPPEAILPEEVEDEFPVHGVEGRASYQTLYLGKSYLGKDGRVNMVEQGVAEVLKRARHKRPVILELGEKDVRVLDQDSKDTVIHHLYTEISACRRRTDELLHYAFISGETYCSLADEFYCHVFEANSEEEAKIILCTIAQGFDRTHMMT